MKKHLFNFLTVALLVCLIGRGILADGGGGWREPTRQEKDFHDRVLTTIQNALPPGPTGWPTVFEPDLRELTRVYKGSEKEPFSVEYRIGWQDTDKKNAGEQKVIQALIAFQQNHEKDPQVAALNAEKQHLLDTSFKQALSKNDVVAMERCNKELDAIDAKLKKIYDAWEKERDAITAANEAHDIELEIWVRVNVFYSGLEKMAAGVPVVGIPVYRIPGGHKGGRWVGEQNRVFLGKNLKIFESNGLMVVKVQPSPGLPNTAVRLIDVSVQADPERARKVLESINWGMLKGLIK